MPELETALTPTQEEILSRRKLAILKLIENMSAGLPLPAQTMLQMYRGTVQGFVDQLTYEQTEELLTKIQNVIDEIRG